MGKFRPPLGSSFQLLLLACSFALAGYAGVRLLADDWFGVALWFVGATVVHDLVLLLLLLPLLPPLPLPLPLPLYATADRALVRTAGAAGHRVGTPPTPSRQWGRAMYVRVPAALSGLLLLVWFPLISGRVADRYESATALSASGFLGRRLLITASLLAQRRSRGGPRHARPHPPGRCDGDAVRLVLMCGLYVARCIADQRRSRAGTPCAPRSRACAVSTRCARPFGGQPPLGPMRRLSESLSPQAGPDIDCDRRMSLC